MAAVENFELLHILIGMKKAFNSSVFLMYVRLPHSYSDRKKREGEIQNWTYTKFALWYKSFLWWQIGQGRKRQVEDTKNVFLFWSRKADSIFLLDQVLSSEKLMKRVQRSHHNGLSYMVNYIAPHCFLSSSINKLMNIVQIAEHKTNSIVSQILCWETVSLPSLKYCKEPFLILMLVSNWGGNIFVG